MSLTPIELKNELQNGPLAAEIAPLIAAGDYQGIADIISRPRFPGMVDRAKFSIWAASTGARATIEDIALDVNSPLRSSALALRDVITGGAAAGVDFSHSLNSVILDQWEAAGKITNEAKQQLLTLAADKVSRADQLNAAPIDAQSVADACR